MRHPQDQLGRRRQVGLTFDENLDRDRRYETLREVEIDVEAIAAIDPDAERRDPLPHAFGHDRQRAIDDGLGHGKIRLDAAPGQLGEAGGCEGLLRPD